MFPETSVRKSVNLINACFWIAYNILLALVAIIVEEQYNLWKRYNFNICDATVRHTNVSKTKIVLKDKSYLNAWEYVPSIKRTLNFGRLFLNNIYTHIYKQEL